MGLSRGVSKGFWNHFPLDSFSWPLPIVGLFHTAHFSLRFHIASATSKWFQISTKRESGYGHGKGYGESSAGSFWLWITGKKAIIPSLHLLTVMGSKRSRSRWVWAWKRVSGCDSAYPSLGYRLPIVSSAEQQATVGVHLCDVPSETRAERNLRT